MSAEVLREAAAKMRERAEYAPDSPWAADVRSDGRAWVDVADEDGHAWGMHGFPRAAEHVASWHPAVALAVADWLEALAEFPTIDVDPEHAEPILASIKAGIIVARAYFGEAS